MGTQKREQAILKIGKRNRVVVFSVILLCLASALLVFDFFSYQIPIQSGQAGIKANRARNGLWLRYLWYFDKHSSKDADKMCSHLKRDEIAYAYFHVRGITRDGSLKFHYPEKARKLVELVHSRAPGCKVIAWAYAGTATEYGGVDLSSDSVRKKMVEEASWLVNTCGFDGVQWDYEFCACGDRGFLKLLDETRNALSDDAILACATPMWYPGGLWGWDEKYFQEVISRCDQIAVMCYDSFFYLPRAYAWLLKQQCKHVLLAANKAANNCRVLFGVPSYDQGTVGHINQAENLRIALPAIKEGLAESKYLSSFEGVAIFAEYTTEENEWSDYRRIWLHPENKLSQPN